jgi:hypothetical protein
MKKSILFLLFLAIFSSQITYGYEPLVVEDKID